MKKVAVVSRKSNQTNAFMTAVEMRKEKGEMPYEVKLVVHPDFVGPMDEFKPDFAIIGPETLPWQAEIIKYLDEHSIPYSIAKMSHFATRQIESIFSKVTV